MLNRCRRDRAKLTILVVALLGLFFSSIASSPGSAQSTNTIYIDAHQPAPPPLPAAFHGGTAKSASGQILGLNRSYLTRNAEPWLPVMGEFHFTRYPRAQWEEEILKMKAAGVQIVATYIFWIHHEEIQAQFDWSGDRDLHQFVELCGKHGMYVYLRIGPWAHGEARNGGLPDWLLEKRPTRTNDPLFMSFVAGYFQQISQQVKGLLWKEGGPIIGVQLENEYADRSTNGGEAYILALKRLAIENGLDVPYYSVTGWDNAVIPKGEVLPIFGGYPDAPWDSSPQALPASEVYLFRFQSRVSGDTRITAAGAADDATSVTRAPTPFITAEMGGGIQDTYHRRPVLTAADVVAMVPVMIGSGVNLYGTYMFQGGENPDGKRATLQESQATHYPTDVPVKSYDFQAPLGEFGQERQSFRKLKIFYYFLNDFGADLAPMKVYPPAQLPKSPDDFSVVRVSVRASHDGGFVFLNNYVRGAEMPARKALQLSIQLPAGLLQFPKEPVDIPSGAYFVWPFNLRMGGVTLAYSTAQLFTKVQDDNLVSYYFLHVPSVRADFVFDNPPPLEIQKGVAAAQDAGVLCLRDVADGVTPFVHWKDANGKTFRLILLSETDAENAWKVQFDDKQYLLLTGHEFYASAQQIFLRSDGVPDFHFRLLPAPDGKVVSNHPLQEVGRLANAGEFSATLPSRNPQIVYEKIQDARPASPIKLGPPLSWRPIGVAQVPDDAAFDRAAKWRLRLPQEPLQGLSDLCLKIEYVGDVARLQNASHLLADDFFNGLPWTIGLRRFLDAHAVGDLTLEILPLRKDAPIFLEDKYRPTFAGRDQLFRLDKITLVPQYELVIESKLAH
ncbi:MAG TPA: beta-galactosidase [Verrucomicrobiae bacterium]|nr:beta-galactosidase [Verrucomicrobiae bacterium]